MATTAAHTAATRSFFPPFGLTDSIKHLGDALGLRDVRPESDTLKKVALCVASFAYHYFASVISAATLLWSSNAYNLGLSALKAVVGIGYYIGQDSAKGAEYLQESFSHLFFAAIDTLLLSQLFIPVNSAFYAAGPYFK